MHDSGYRDVDYVLTTRELAIMIKQAGIDFLKLEDAHYDRLMGESTGAAVIFGATGGVMEAALRTAYELVTGREVPFENLNITPVRGVEGMRVASVKIEKTLKEWSFLEGVELNCAVAHGLANAKTVMDEVKAEKQITTLSSSWLVRADVLAAAVNHCQPARRYVQKEQLQSMPKTQVCRSESRTSTPRLLRFTRISL
ncbi:hypothetical protein MASR2M69_17180 [Bacteroidota bacterium]